MKAILLSLQNAKQQAKELLDFLAELRGDGPEPNAPLTELPKVGDRVWRKGEECKVLAVDESVDPADITLSRPNGEDVSTDLSRLTTGPKTLTSHTGEAGVEIGQEVLDGLERVLLAARSEEEALETAIQQGADGIDFSGDDSLSRVAKLQEELNFVCGCLLPENSVQSPRNCANSSMDIGHDADNKDIDNNDDQEDGKKMVALQRTLNPDSQMDRITSGKAEDSKLLAEKIHVLGEMLTKMKVALHDHGDVDLPADFLDKYDLGNLVHQKWLEEDFEDYILESKQVHEDGMRGVKEAEHVIYKEEMYASKVQAKKDRFHHRLAVIKDVIRNVKAIPHEANRRDAATRIVEASIERLNALRRQVSDTNFSGLKCEVALAQACDFVNELSRSHAGKDSDFDLQNELKMLLINLNANIHQRTCDIRPDKISDEDEVELSKRIDAQQISSVVRDEIDREMALFEHQEESHIEDVLDKRRQDLIAKHFRDLDKDAKALLADQKQIEEKVDKQVAGEREAKKKQLRERLAARRAGRLKEAQIIATVAEVLEQKKSELEEAQEADLQVDGARHGFQKNAEKLVANNMVKCAFQLLGKVQEMKKIEPLTKTRRGHIVVASAPTRDERQQLLMDHFESVDRLGKVLYAKKQEQKYNLRQRMNARRRSQLNPDCVSAAMERTAMYAFARVP